MDTVENKGGKCTCGEKCCGSIGSAWCPGGFHSGWPSVILRVVLALIILSVVFIAGVKLGEFKVALEGYVGGGRGYHMMGGGRCYYMGSGMMRNSAPLQATIPTPSAK